MVKLSRRHGSQLRRVLCKNRCIRVIWNGVGEAEVVVVLHVTMFCCVVGVTGRTLSAHMFTGCLCLKYALNRCLKIAVTCMKTAGTHRILLVAGEGAQDRPAGATHASTAALPAGGG